MHSILFTRPVRSLKNRKSAHFRPNMPSTGDQLSHNSDMTREHCGQGSCSSMLSPPAVQTQPPSIASTHIVHDFVTFFGRKVEDIETTTSAATSPDIQLRPTSSSEMDMGWVGSGRVKKNGPTSISAIASVTSIRLAVLKSPK